MRQPAVAGAFYPSLKSELVKEIEESFAKEAGMPEFGNEKGLAAVVTPHAGYFYSGWVAAFAYREIAKSFKEPPTFVIAGPNHTGQGSALSLSLQDWQMPFGVVKNDSEFGKLMQKKSRYIGLDETAHEFEHSIEVQLPFLQYLLLFPFLSPLMRFYFSLRGLSFPSISLLFQDQSNYRIQ